jgi:hypothetical protein
VRIAFTILFLNFLAGVPAWAQEALVVGLKGPVHTVLTEDFTSEDAVHRESTGTSLDIYDRHGYQLEVYRYKPDGTLWVHTVMDRQGPLVSRTQVTGTPPFESGSTQNVFDAQGRVIETDTYDANGILVSRSKGEFVEQQSNASIYRRTESKADGTESTAESIATTDHETGLTHQVETRDGKPEADWVIQRNEDGTVERDKIVYKDGSYNERERKADGTTVEDRYSAPAKSHTYQKSDEQGHLTEVTEKSDSYYIRCTYSFDKDGRPTGQINYDAAGSILDKSTTEYRDDSHGNWVEKKSIVWDTKSDPMQPKMVGISLRTINYY